MPVQCGGVGGRGYTRNQAWPQSYGHRPSHPYNAGTEGYGGFTDQADLLLARSAKRREVFGESHEGEKGELHPTTVRTVSEVSFLVFV